MAAKELQEEVRNLIEELITNDEEADSIWIAEKILKGKRPPEGRDKAWFMMCAYEALRHAISQVLRQYKLKEGVGSGDQRSLPGMKRVQRAYLIKRDGNHAMVPIFKITEIEMEEKMVEIHAMGEGCFEHYDELSRFKDWRFHGND